MTTARFTSYTGYISVAMWGNILAPLGANSQTTSVVRSLGAKPALLAQRCATTVITIHGLEDALVTASHLLTSRHDFL